MRNLDRQMSLIFETRRKEEKTVEETLSCVVKWQPWPRCWVITICRVTNEISVTWRSWNADHGVCVP